EGSCMGVVVDGAGVKSWLVVDAEGPGGRLLGRSGIETHQKGFVMGYNTVLEGVEVDPEMVELWFSEELAKGFFAWVIPIDGNRVRCGLGTSGGDGYESLRAFIKKRFGIGEPPRVGSGLICTGPPVDKTTYNGLLLTGDAAGQVKATTGGGVVIGGLCAQIAGEEAAEALTSGDASWGRLSEYDRRWRRLYGGELRTMHAARRLMNKVGDERFNRLMASLKESGLQSRLEELVSGGDMDLQSGVIKKALMNPGIMSVMLRGVGSVALGELLSMLR
ncbi:NAD(P)/FAD-dependent oxidoreductase, partial [Candidatus Bathyarchaeota archaeon]|nr:NAD(P)/FAD-dependent oxidoreductase [Candidatus Bathyarchaeota archaeon]